MRPSLLLFSCVLVSMDSNHSGGAHGGNAPSDCCSRSDRERSPCADLWLCMCRRIRRLLCCICYVVHVVVPKDELSEKSSSNS